MVVAALKSSPRRIFSAWMISSFDSNNELGRKGTQMVQQLEQMDRFFYLEANWVKFCIRRGIVFSLDLKDDKLLLIIFAKLFHTNLIGFEVTGNIAFATIKMFFKHQLHDSRQQLTGKASTAPDVVQSQCRRSRESIALRYKLETIDPRHDFTCSRSVFGLLKIEIEKSLSKS